MSCPHCAHNQPGAAFCNHCGSPLALHNHPTVQGSLHYDPTVAMTRKKRGVPWWVIPMVAVIAILGWAVGKSYQAKMEARPKISIVWSESTPFATTGYAENVSNRTLNDIQIRVGVPREKIGNRLYYLSKDHVFAVWGEKVVYKDLPDPTTGILQTRVDSILRTSIVPGQRRPFSVYKGRLTLPIGNLRVMDGDSPIPFRQSIAD